MPCLVRLAVFIVDAILVEDLIGLLATDVGDVCRSTLGVGEDLEALVDLGCILLEVEALCLLLIIQIRIEATTQYEDVAELVVMGQRGLQRLDASHGKACHGAMVLVCEATVIAFDIRNDATHQVVGKVLHQVAHVAILRRDIAVGHHHDHRQYLAFCEEVVEDEACTAHCGPGIVCIATTMHQIENWQLLLGVLVACWGPYMQSTGSVKGFAVIVALSDGAMWHVFHGEELVAIVDLCDGRGLAG